VLLLRTVCCFRQKSVISPVAMGEEYCENGTCSADDLCLPHVLKRLREKV
jgi:hypothetical protein